MNPEHWIDDVEHPAAARGRRLGVPAGQVIAAVLIALAVAALFNSASIVRTGEGMDSGVTRTVVLGVGKPLNQFAAAVGFTKPRATLDALLNNQALVASNTELTNGNNSVLDLPSAPASPTTGATGTPDSTPSQQPLLYPQDVGGVAVVQRPTTTQPLRLLVTGDSLSTYMGYDIANDVNQKAKVSVKSYNGTGLTQPNFFNWQLAAEKLSRQYEPDAVVVVLGGNDGWNMTHAGQYSSWGSNAWVTEYARRVAVVARTFLANGVKRVYWSGPPTAADSKWNRIFADINQAVSRAMRATPGGRYVDLYSGTAVNGRYSQTLVIDGKRVNARQSDGIHFSLAGAQLPAELIIRALEREYGNLR